MADVPDRTDELQNEETEFRYPINQETLDKIAGIINRTLNEGQFAQVGGIEIAAVDEATFNQLKGEETVFFDATLTKYALMDGRSVVGSLYHSQTGNTNIPDARADFFRMKDHGSGRDTRGDVATGTERISMIRTHSHTGVDSTVFDSLTQGRNVLREVNGPPGTIRATRQLDDPNPAVTLNPFRSERGSLNSPFDSLALPEKVEMRPQNVHLNFFIKIN